MEKEFSSNQWLSFGTFGSNVGTILVIVNEGGGHFNGQEPGMLNDKQGLGRFRQ